MDNAKICLGQIRNLQSKETSEESISMLTKIFHRIVNNPGEEKYRSVKLSNEKFQKYIWSIEPAQLFVVLAGFECITDEDKLKLPSSTDLSPLLKLLTDDSQLVTLPTQTQDSSQTTRKRCKLDTSVAKGNIYNSNSTTTIINNNNSSNNTTISNSDQQHQLNALLEMGYESSLASLALTETSNAGIDKAIEWLASNQPIQTNPTVPQLSVNTTASTNYLSDNNNNNNNDINDVNTSSLQNLPIISRYQDTCGERYAFREKQRQEVLKKAMREKVDESKARQNLKANLESERNYKKAALHDTKLLHSQEPQVHSQPTTSPVTLTEKTITESDRVSIRIRLPDGKQSLIQINSDALVGDLYKEVSEICKYPVPDLIITIPFSGKHLHDHSLTLQESSLGHGGNILIKLSNQIGQCIAGAGRVFPIIEFKAPSDFTIELSRAPQDKLVVLMCTSSGSRESKEFENEFDSINADLGMDQEVIFMRVDIGFVTLLRGLAGKMKLPCFHLYKNSKLMDSLSTMVKQDLVDKIIALKDKSPDDDNTQEKMAPENTDTTNDANSNESDNDNDDNIS